METQRRVQLRTKPRGRDLDGHIFLDDGHAREWLTQDYEWTKTRYEVAIVSARRRKCCGELYAVKTLKVMSVGEYLDSVRQRARLKTATTA